LTKQQLFLAVFFRKSISQTYISYPSNFISLPCFGIPKFYYQGIKRESGVNPEQYPLL